MELESESQFGFCDPFPIRFVVAANINIHMSFCGMCDQLGTQGDAREGDGERGGVGKVREVEVGV